MTTTQAPYIPLEGNHPLSPPPTTSNPVRFLALSYKLTLTKIVKTYLPNSEDRFCVFVWTTSLVLGLVGTLASIHVI